MPNIFSDNGLAGLKLDYGEATVAQMTAATSGAPFVIMNLSDQAHNLRFHNDSDLEVAVMIRHSDSASGAWQPLFSLAPGQDLPINNYAGPMCLVPPRSQIAVYRVATYAGYGNPAGKCRIYCWLA
jgi:hypothetical protein